MGKTKDATKTTEGRSSSADANGKGEQKRSTETSPPGQRKSILKQRQQQARRAQPPMQALRIMVPPSMLCPGSQSSRGMTREELEYMNTLPREEREQVVKTMQAMSVRSKPLKFRVLESNLPNKADILTKLQHESSKFEGWVENALSLPIDRWAPSPLSSNDTAELTKYLQGAKATMDKHVHGQHEAKDEVLRLICQWAVSGQLKTFALGLEGPPGIGKTTFAKTALAEVMGRPFCFISLGGMSDASSLVGHSFTYEGAVCGRIADAVRSSGVMNPVLYFDELDKVSRSFKGDEVINVLIHLTDREQNAYFRDRYFHGVDLDLSAALMVFSYNDPRDVNPILMDRLSTIRLDTPSVSDKIHIASRHLIPRALDSMKLETTDVHFEKEAIEDVIRKHTTEPGVRSLERKLGRLINTIGVAGRVHSSVLVNVTGTPIKLPCNVDRRMVNKILQSQETDDSSRVSHTLMYS